jgi:hypothetical protein
MKRMFAMSCVLLFLACKSMLPTSQPLTPYDIVIDHRSGILSPVGLLKKKPGEIVKVKIQDSDLDCFVFNPTVVQIQQPQTRSLRERVAEPLKETSFELLYDGDPIELTVEAVKKDPHATCAGLLEFKTGGDRPPWKIRILTDGWDLAFAGAFTADGLSNPKFEVVAGTRKKADNTEEAGFIVSEVESARDEARLGAAAMVHLYHTNPERIGLWSVNWVPVSFGLGVGDNSQTRYYLGTGIKFDKKLFLTAGMALGPVNYMPTGLDANNFTTNANILGNIPSRVERTWFVGISYSFAGVGPDSFRGPFAAVKPVVNEPEEGEGEGEGDGEEGAVAEAEISDLVSGANATYKIDVANTGDAEGTFRVVHAPPPGLTITKWKCAAGCADTNDHTGAIDMTLTKLGAGKAVTFEVTTTGTPTANGKVLVTGGGDPVSVEVEVKE